MVTITIIAIILFAVNLGLAIQGRNADAARGWACAIIEAVIVLRVVL